jgi:nucleoside-diphosphate-sugar epimerase
VDAIVHQAAMAGAASWERFDLYSSCNITATQRLLEAIRSSGKHQRFVQISTSSVYGVEAVGPEDTPLRPASPYGITKLAAEQLAHAYGRSFDFPVIALRYFSIYGPRQRPDMAYHIFIDALLRDQPITIFGDGEQTRGNTFIADCIDGTVRALNDGVPGESYNLGGGVPISLNDAIAIIEEVVGRPAQRNYRPARLGDQRHTFADCSKAFQHFGYTAKTHPEAGLRQQVEWQLRLAGELAGATSRGYDASEMSI